MAATHDPASTRAPDLAPGRPELEPGAGAGAGPRSRAFDDIYFSPEDGLAESEAVFLQGCGLPEAWAGRTQFTVAELGFGTGLNVAALLRLWGRARPPGGRLHVVSVEGFPLARAQAEPALAAFPVIAAEADALLAAWPPRIKGVHRRCLANGVFLTLAYLPVAEALAALDFAADAWFLDGFAPSKNPEMWSADVLAAVAARSRPGARLATFSVAGAVRRGLEAVGFAVEKKAGFGGKRERLEAVYHGPARGPLASPGAPRAVAPEGPVLILGAGIAGANVALALRRRGVEAHILDAGDGPGAGASGMPAVLVAPRLDLDDRPEARFHRAAYAHALAAYAGSPAFRPTGIVRAAKDTADAERLARLLASEALPPEMACAASVADAGVEAEATALLLPDAGLLDPRAYLEEALAGITVGWGARVARLEREGDIWVARDADGRALGDGAGCVVALGVGLTGLAPTAHLAIRPTRGQMTLARLDGPAPTRPVVWGPYLAPLGDGRLLVGATYDPWETAAAPTPDAASDAANLAALAAFAPALAARIDSATLEGRVGVRAATPDRLPYVGAAPDAEAFNARFAALAQGRADDGPPGPVLEGLYVLGGLGSRGFLWAPALAEALASEMLGEPGALEADAAAALHPARGLLRALKRGIAPAPFISGNGFD
jgi:tRNA 5-methylaminomethyl-2-thiouridine biosynthesis bifunctional protein